MNSRGNAINYEAHELYRKIAYMIEGWNREKMGMKPKYLFLSNDAYVTLKDMGLYLGINQEYNTFMGIEIAPVGVPGIYAALGGEF